MSLLSLNPDLKVFPHLAYTCYISRVLYPLFLNVLIPCLWPCFSATRLASLPSLPIRILVFRVQPGCQAVGIFCPLTMSNSVALERDSPLGYSLYHGFASLLLLKCFLLNNVCFCLSSLMEDPLVHIFFLLPDPDT